MDQVADQAYSPTALRIQPGARSTTCQGDSCPYGDSNPSLSRSLWILPGEAAAFARLA